MDQEEDQQGNTLSSAFPAPPPFYKHFTQENLKKLQEKRDEINSLQGDQNDPPQVASSDQILRDRMNELPEELRYLIPPAPPTSGEYNSFGDHYNINATAPSLKALNIEQVYETTPSSQNVQDENVSFDRPFYLTKIARSILLNFLELVSILEANPEEFQPKMDDLRTLFINAHHLINEYRPHQARETLIAIMETQLEAKKAEIEEVKRQKERVDGLLAAPIPDITEKRIGDEAIVTGSDDVISNTKLKQADVQSIWDALDAIDV